MKTRWVFFLRAAGIGEEYLLIDEDNRQNDEYGDEGLPDLCEIIQEEEEEEEMEKEEEGYRIPGEASVLEEYSSINFFWRSKEDINDEWRWTCFF